MTILLFTVLNCKACDAHRHEVIDIAREANISINVYDIDDPRYLSMCMAGMRKYGIRRTPSMVLLDEYENIIITIEGVQRSIQKLQAKLDETK